MSAVCSSVSFRCGGANGCHSVREVPNGSSRQLSGHSWDLSLIHSHARRRAFCLELFSRAGFLFVSHDCGQKKMAAGKPTAICSLAELSSEAERHTCTIGARRTLILDRGTKAGVAVEHVGEQIGRAHV